MPIENRRQRQAAAPGGRRNRPEAPPKAKQETPEGEDDLFAGTLEEGADDAAADDAALDDSTLDDFAGEGEGEGEEAAPPPPAKHKAPPGRKAPPAAPEEDDTEAQLSEDPSVPPQPVPPPQQQQPQAGAPEPVTPQAQKLADRFREEVKQAQQMQQGAYGEPEDFDTTEAIGLTQAGSMFELADSLRQAGFRLGLQNIRKQMLETLENFGLIADDFAVAEA